jgi:hypothetical protein
MSHSSPGILSRTLVVVASLLGSSLLCEGLIRLALFSPLTPAFAAKALRQPALYAYPSSDDFWKLESSWTRRARLEGFHHPRLGATFPRTKRNPLGVAGAPRPLPDPNTTEPAILFYGDSFLTAPALPAAIPRLLELRLASTPVWNFGMWSYGLDQMVLRLEETHGYFRRPIVLIGVLTDDLDRCVLSVRLGQKPRFVIDREGELRLTNVPIREDQAAYLDRHPPEVWSYALRMLAIAIGKTRLAQRWGLFRPDERREEAQAISRALILRAMKLSRERDMPLRFVIFHPAFELRNPTWRGRFLRDTLESLGIEYLDTEPLLRRTIESGAATMPDLYDATAHHTQRANTLIVDAIIERWPELRGRRHDTVERAAGYSTHP